VSVRNLFVPGALVLGGDEVGGHVFEVVK
jgi:hypothetical protein